MKKRLFLIFHGRFPSEKAASLFAAKSAEAFADQGLRVTLVVPMRRGIIAKDLYDYYGVLRIFDIVYIPTVDFFGIYGLKKLAFLVSYVSFSKATFSYIKRNSEVDDIIYSNEILPLSFLARIRKNLFYEMHDFPESKLKLFAFMIKKMKWILIHNRWKLNEAKKIFPLVSTDRFMYEPNAVDIDAFNIPLTKEEARVKLSLPPSKKIVVYTGHLYSWKGTDTLARSAKFLPEDFLVVFVGGTEVDITKFRNKYSQEKNVLVIGHVKHSEIPSWQKAADVLVLPNTAKEKISAFYTSPMKLFEYMASSRSIVATNIPSIKEILNETNAIIVIPDDEKSLAEGIIVASDKNVSDRISSEALRNVENYTWVKRAKRIMDFINKTK